MRRMAIENHVLERHGDLELFLGTESSSQGGKGKPLTSPFISVMGAEDVNDAMETFIVLYRNDEDKDEDESSGVDVTVFSEELTTTQVSFGF